MDFKTFLSKVKEFEGFRSKAYKCPSGVFTIGYGHTHGVIDGMTVCEVSAFSMLLYDFSIVEYQLLSVHPDFNNLPDGYRFALMDFVFNIGISKYKRSSLYRVVCAINDKSHPTEREKMLVSLRLSLYCYANGKKLRGLENRRNWEISLLDF